MINYGVQTWGEVLIASFYELWLGVVAFAPRLIGAIIVFVIGWVVKWFFIIVFFTATVEVLGLTDVTNFLSEQVLPYLGNVFVAALILVAAALIADAIGKLVTASAKAANLPSSGFLGGVSKWAIWIFAILAAMAQLKIAGPMVQTLFIGVVGALALALGLAFGLGGKDTAAQYL